MTIFRKTAAIGIAALMSIAATAPTLAGGSMEIKNCTQTDVRIFFYNNSDTAMLISTKGSITIDQTKTGTLSVDGKGPSKARVFKRQILDNPVLVQSNLGHNSSYYLTAKGGEWRLSTSDDHCFQSHLKNTNRHISGKYYFANKRSSVNIFKMDGQNTLLAANLRNGKPAKWHKYFRVNTTKFQSSSGQTYELQANGDLVWRGGSKKIVLKPK